jgi:putative hydrolase
MTGEPSVSLRAVRALDRAAFLLERQNASSYRVKAFRRAAESVAATSSADLAALAARGALTTLAGVGDTTATVIHAVVRGEEPAYVTRLEGEAWPGSAADGADLLSLLRGDLHTHSDWSDGGSPIELMAVTARDLGREYLALTDHSPRLTVANGLTAERLEKQLDVVARLNVALAPFRILTGIEVDILDDGALDQSDELLGRLDVVVASVHSKLRMDRRSMTERMLAAVANPHTDVLGHCTGRMVSGSKNRPESEFDAAAVFTACRDARVAVEINSRPERLDPPRRLLSQAVEVGCLFSIDTDAHAPGQLAWSVLGAARASECGVPAEAIVTTWSVDDVLAWTQRS